MYRDKLEQVYIDYLNNFITLSGYASYYGLEEDEAKLLINAAKLAFERIAAQQ